MYFFPVFRPLDNLKFRSTIPAGIFKNGHSNFHFKDSYSSFSSTEFPEKCQEGISLQVRSKHGQHVPLWESSADRDSLNP